MSSIKITIAKNEGIIVCGVVPLSVMKAAQS